MKCVSPGEYEGFGRRRANQQLQHSTHAPWVAVVFGARHRAVFVIVFNNSDSDSTVFTRRGLATGLKNMSSGRLHVTAGRTVDGGYTFYLVNFLRSTCGRPTLHFLLNRNRRLHDLEANGRLTVVSAQAHLLEAGKSLGSRVLSDSGCCGCGVQTGKLQLNRVC